MRSLPGVSTLILFYIIVAEVHVIFTDADTRIKGVQIGDNEIEQYFCESYLQSLGSCN